MKTTLAAPTHLEHRSIGDTTVSNPVAWISVAGFLLLIASQLAVTLSNGSLARSVGGWWQASTQALTADASDRERTRNALLHDATERLEEDLTEASWLRRLVREWGQLALTRLGGVGNTQVLLGDRGGEGRWLFFAPATEHVLAPPFLDSGTQRRRAKAASAWEPRPHTDPLAAIRGLAADLDGQGIRLLVVPAPSKVSLRPERLSSSLGSPVVNSSYGEFLQRLESEGISTVDLMPILMDLPPDERYLARDSHWSPAAVEAVARAVAERARALGSAPFEQPASHYQRRHLAVEGRGDLVDLLGLPPGHEPISQRVKIQPVFERNQPWRADRRAPVLLLGDSFSNVYSQEGLGWGSGAGPG